MSIKIIKSIPYSFYEEGFHWTILSVRNNFATLKNTLVSAEYENQYGHLRTMNADELFKLIKEK